MKDSAQDIAPPPPTWCQHQGQIRNKFTAIAANSSCIISNCFFFAICSSYLAYLHSQIATVKPDLLLHFHNPYLFTSYILLHSTHTWLIKFLCGKGNTLSKGSWSQGTELHIYNLAEMGSVVLLMKNIYKLGYTTDTFKQTNLQKRLFELHWMLTGRNKLSRTFLPIYSGKSSSFWGVRTLTGQKLCLT